MIERLTDIRSTVRIQSSAIFVAGIGRKPYLEKLLLFNVNYHIEKKTIIKKKGPGMLAKKNGRTCVGVEQTFTVGLRVSVKLRSRRR